MERINSKNSGSWANASFNIVFLAASPSPLRILDCFSASAMISIFSISAEALNFWENS
jgi:hypothetical protein